MVWVWLCNGGVGLHVSTQCGYGFVMVGCGCMLAHGVGVAWKCTTCGCSFVVVHGGLLGQGAWLCSGGITITIVICSDSICV